MTLQQHQEVNFVFWHLMISAVSGLVLGMIFS